MIGKTLGHYQISSQIGKGGMGEVHQAKGQKLGRDVAINVLPDEFAKDVDRVARFQREARILASLNKPNIAAIHGLEESDGRDFLCGCSICAHATTKITIVLDRMEELKQAIPVK